MESLYKGGTESEILAYRENNSKPSIYSLYIFSDTLLKFFVVNWHVILHNNETWMHMLCDAVALRRVAYKQYGYPLYTH